MASSIVSTLFISTIFFLISTQNIVTSHRMITSYPLIQKACSNKNNNIDFKLCIQILQSHRQVRSAKNLFELSIGIIESGISNATSTRAYVENWLKKPRIGPKLKGVLKECKLSYDSVIASFNSALSEIRDDKEYKTATYDLILASTDYIEPCRKAMESKKIKDRIISIGNRVVPIFGLSASGVVDRLDISKHH